MKKILILPFLRMASGHHQVADALTEYIREIDSSFVCEKIEILSYSYGMLESMVSGFYLKWIHSLPGSYSWIYKKSVCRNHREEQRKHMYEFLFQHQLLHLISEKRPDMVICTHGLPSYLINRLKTRGLLSLPVVNVYTDYFINDLWGIKEINVHFVPDVFIKQWLIARGVNAKQIYVTGIPVHPKITPSDKRTSSDGLINALVAGGSVGAGFLSALLHKTSPNHRVHYHVLCGKNNRLYEGLQKANRPHITPYPYIESKERINDLYDQANAVITKPGGVTISECLRKDLPILVYHSLPGQEEMNLQHLKRLNLVVEWDGWKHGNMEEQILDLASTDRMNVKPHRAEYHRHLKDKDLFSTLRSVLSGNST